MAGAERTETAEREAFGKVTERAATRPLVFLLGMGAERLTLTVPTRRAAVRVVAACAPFRFFIACRPLVS
jgi:hypothetical protein